MNGNEMDTTCSEIVAEINVSVDGLLISDLTGIQYFDNLESLGCTSNLLTTLPSLPNSIQTLLCDNNQLTSLTQLPTNLRELYCSYNNLSSLPELPSLLTTLVCFNNQLTTLPILPESLVDLNCNNNLLTQLPSLPPSIEQIDCNNNSLSSLPELPGSLVLLTCVNNSISTIPDFSDALLTLNCSGNLLTSLPDLKSLHVIICEDNQLTWLPTFPEIMYAIQFNNNQITYLNPLPSGIQWLQCSNNNITCLPFLPSSIGFSPENFDISNNPFVCLPNYIPAMGVELLSFPLCTIDNANACEGSNDIGIAGKIYEDLNNNCEFDAGDIINQNVQIKLYNPITDEFASTTSASNGVYNFSEEYGIYIVSIDTLNKPYTINCPSPGLDSTVVLDSISPLVGDVNFNIKCKTGLDLGVQSIMHQNALIFPGLQHTLQVMVGSSSHWYGLDCASGTSGQVAITVAGPVMFDGIPPGALTPQVNGNVFTYEIADFAQVDNANDFLLYFKVDTTAQNADLICVTAEITSTDMEIISSNNILEYCYSVVNSYDPNYKETYPKDVLPGSEDWFTYTIHFQNLGTAPAINIRVLDTLDSNLDLTTFEVINYSHFNTATLANGIVNFRFPNIMLADSLSDPIGSQGFVQYRIKPNSELSVGTELENTAHIFFDYNPAIVTNTTVNTYINILSNSKVSPTFRLFPNPNAGVFMVDGLDSKDIYSIVVSDISGKIIETEVVANKNQKQIELIEHANGIYFLSISNNTVHRNYKLILQK